ncbi:MAG TPA: GNAT family N-acetyltransferase [Pseudolabrys sp.]|nr:GNAT family N-acetyltransferase [Pseudolabrys sp.]
MSVTIRAAEPADTALILSLVRELAEYERLSSEVDATEDNIAKALFAPQSRVFCDIAAYDGAPAGFALWFLNFSSFRGRHGIYLEDIFVRAEYRGKGIGKRLMQRLAQHCVSKGWARLEWSVLDWNKPSIEFYKSIGAQVMEDWRICRMSGEALQRFASDSAR